MSADPSERWVQILAAVVVALIGWLCYQSIQQGAQIQSLQYQYSGMIQAQQNVIPPVVEASLRELREKTNTDRDLILKMANTAADSSPT